MNVPDRWYLSASYLFRITAVVGTITYLQLAMDSWGVSPFMISLLEVAGWVGFIVAVLPFSQFADETKLYRDLLLLTAFLTSLFLYVYALIPAGAVIGIILLRAVISIPYAAFSPIAHGLVSIHSVPHNRGSHLSVLTAGKSAGFAFARLVAGFLFGAVAYHSGFVVFGSIMLFGCFWLFPLPEEKTISSIDHPLSEIAASFQLPSMDDLRTVLSDHGLGSLLLGLMVRKMAVMGIFSLVAVFVAGEKGISAAVMGLIIAVDPIVQTFCKPVAGRIADTIGRKTIFVAGFIGSISVPLIFSAVDSVLGLATGFAVLGFSYSMISGGSIAFIGDLADSDHSATYMSFRSMSTAIAGITGALAAGSLASLFGFTVMMYGMAVIMTIATLIVSFNTDDTF